MIFGVIYMSTWFYSDYKPLSVIIDKAQKLPLSDRIMLVTSKSKAMSGNILPKSIKKTVPCGAIFLGVMVRK